MKTSLILKNKKVTFFSGLFLLFMLLNIVTVLHPNTVPAYISRPLILVVMMVMYVSVVKKPYLLFVVCQFLTMVADFLYFFDKKYFFTGILFYVVGQILLTTLIVSFIKKIKLVEVIGRLSIFLLLFALIYIVVLEEQNNKLPVLLFGVSISVLMTFTLVNYLQNMNKSNFLLLLGLVLAIISDVVMTLNLSYLASDIPVYLINTVLVVLVHYIICLSFIGREEANVLQLEEEVR